MTDLASLKLAIDSTDVKSGVTALDGLTAAGAKTEAQFGKLKAETAVAARSASDYAASAQRQATAALAGARGMGQMATSSGLAGHHVQNLTFQLNDMVTGLVSGQRPMTVMMQQGAQIGQIMQQSGLGVRGFASELLSMAGIIKVSGDATLAAAAAEALANRAAIASVVQRTSVTLAAAQADIAIASAQTANAATAAGVAAGQELLAIATTEATAAAAENIAASTALSAANVLVTETTTAATAAETVRLGTMGYVAIAIAALAAAYGIYLLVTRQATQAAQDDAAALEAVKFASSDLSTAQGILGRVMNMATGQINTQSGALVNLARAQAMVANVQARARASEARRGLADTANANLRASLDGNMMGLGVRFTKPAESGVAARVLSGTNTTKQGLDQLNNLEKAGTITGEAFNKAAASVVNLGVEMENIKISEGLLRMINGAGTASDRAMFLTPKTGGGGSSRGGASRADSEARKNALEEERKAAEAAALMWSTLNTQIKAATASALAYAGEQTNVDLAGTFETAGGRELAAQRIKDTKDLADAMDRLQQIAGQLDLGSVFGDIGSAIDGMAGALGRVEEANQAYLKVITMTGVTEAQRAEAEKTNNRAKLNGQVALLGSAKGLFSQQSAAYKAIDAMQKVAAARTMINTALEVANGAAKMFSFLGPFAFPVVAAMMAVMAGLGFKGGSGGAAKAPPTPQEMQAAQGTGSVLGDSTEKSNSISNSLELMLKNTNKDLEYSNQMVRSLRSIENNIGNLGSLLAKQLGVSGGAFDQSKLGLGTKTVGLPKEMFGILSQIPIIGDLLGAIGKFIFNTKTTVKLIDQGLTFTAQTIGDIISSGIDAATYQTVEINKKKKLFGITVSNKTSTQDVSAPLENDLSTQINLLIGSMRDGILAAANVLGIEGSQAALDAFTVNIGKISLMGLKGTEVQAQLEAVFSKLGDDMARAAIPGLDAFQQVGEGLFETLARLAKDYQTVDVTLQAMGMTFGAIGPASVAARESLIALFGSLDEFVSQSQFYRDNFLTAAEQLAPITAAVAAAMESLGLAGVTTKDQFKSVVSAIDLTSDSGQLLYATLLSIAPGFLKVANAADAAAVKLEADAKTAADKADALNKTRLSMEATLLDMTGDKAGALAIRRAQEISAMDESLRSLQLQIYAQQDVAAARDVLNTAYQRERSELTATADKFKALGDSLRQFRATLYGGEGSSYGATSAALRSTGNMAALGSESAIGSLPGVASSFLASSRLTSSSLNDYKRDVARVATIVDRAIGGADGMASAAQQQLAALDKSVEGLLEVKESVVTVEQAIADLREAMAVPTLAIADTAIKAREEDKQAAVDLLKEVAAMREENRTLNLKTVENTATMARFLARVDAAGVRVFNDNSGPIYTTAAV